MIICVLGPTGVGKTKVSEYLSKKYDGVVINADAMQVYKELNIGTAKIKKEEMSSKKHYLFDIKKPNEFYSVYYYQKDSRKIIEENKDKNIIIVGGTGLYVKACLYNYEFDEIIKRNTYDDYTNEELYQLLEKMGKLDEVHINNRKRMISKLNSSPNNNGKNELLYDNVVMIGLTSDRKKLYDRIDKRVDEMINEGLVDEVKRLYDKYGNTKSLTTGIGYKEIINYLDGLITLDDAIELIKSRSRKYAKRQYTWFNNQMNLKWFNIEEDTFDDIVKYIDKSA